MKSDAQTVAEPEPQAPRLQAPEAQAPEPEPEPQALSTRARPARGQELELTVDSLAHGGAVRGDKGRAIVYKPKRTYAHARTLEVLEPSPERIEPLAKHPGVPWQVL